MPLVTSKELLEEAFRTGFAVGAFNANNMEMVQAIVEAAEEERAPVIVQISQGAIEYAGAEFMAAIVRVAAERASVPVVCHLDHGLDLDINIRCLKAGFTSLMIDGSALSFEENARLTREVVKLGHAVGIPVEGEIGKVPDAEKGPLSPEELKDFLTTPEEAVRFVEATGVDFLAVSVGSAHRMKVQSANLDIERILAIRQAVNIPLVLHGASGVTDESVRAAVGAGIAKINFATELNKAFTRNLRQKLAADPEVVDVRKYTRPAREAVKEVVRQKIRLVGADGKAGALAGLSRTPETRRTRELVE